MQICSLAVLQWYGLLFIIGRSLSLLEMMIQSSQPYLIPKGENDLVLAMAIDSDLLCVIKASVLATLWRDLPFFCLVCAHQIAARLGTSLLNQKKLKQCMQWPIFLWKHSLFNTSVRKKILLYVHLLPRISRTQTSCILKNHFIRKCYHNKYLLNFNFH